VGRYTDDTQVRIAVTEVLLKLGDAANAHDDIAIFVAAFQAIRAKAMPDGSMKPIAGRRPAVTDDRPTESPPRLRR
jgi:hypothetical protein